jgi:hypothetical protein
MGAGYPAPIFCPEHSFDSVHLPLVALFYKNVPVGRAKRGLNLVAKSSNLVFLYKSILSHRAGKTVLCAHIAISTALVMPY